MSTLKAPAASFNPPRSPSSSSWSDTSGRDNEKREIIDSTPTEGANPWPSGESRGASLNSYPLQSTKSSETDERPVLADGEVISRKKNAQEKDGHQQKIKSKLKEILLPQKFIRFQEHRQQSEYQPNPSTKTTAKYEILTGYTEENGETVAKLSIEVDVKSEEIKELVKREKKLELVVRLEAYDPVKLRSYGSRERPWRYPFPQGTTHIKVLPTLAAQREVDDSAKNLEIRVELKVECFEIV